jgi:RND family efflux transporter MFP subunit
VGVTRTRTALALASLALAGAAAAWACAGGSADAAVPHAAAPTWLLPVESHRVRDAEGYEVEQRFAGRVVCRRTSELGFEHGGRVMELLVDEGSLVVEGQVLARLDTRLLRVRGRELEAKRAEANGRVQETQARLALARVTAQRHRQLLAAQHTSPQRYDEALYAERALVGQLAAARAEAAAVDAALEHLEIDLDLTELRAPFDGQITARRADEGSILSPGEPVLALAEIGALEARVGVPASDADRLAPGSRYALEVEGVAVDGMLESVIQTVASNTRTVTALFRLESPPSGIRHGDVAELSLETRVAGPGFWLPISALRQGRRGLWSAFALVDDDGALRAEPRDLQMIHAEAERAYVRGTLREGERVVATGLHRVAPGQRVRLAR